MRRIMMTAAAAMALGIGGSAGAQEVVHWSAPPAAAHGQFSYFPMGTPLRLTTHDELSSRNNHAGDRFSLSVAEPMVYRGQIVVPAGALAVGEVMRIEHNGAAGKRGEMAVRLLYVQTPSGPVQLSGKTERAGASQAVLAIGGATFVAWPMIFIHGTSARLPAETGIVAYLGEDLRFPVAADEARTVAYSGDPQVAAALPARFDPSAFSGVRR